MADCAACHAAAHRLDHVVGGDPSVDAARDARGRDLSERLARFQLARLEPIHLLKAVIGDDDAFLGIEHHQPLDHVVQRRVEEVLLLLELVVCGLQLRECRVDEAQRQHGKGEIGGRGQCQCPERHHRHLFNERAYAGGYLESANERAGGEDGSLAREGGPRQGYTLFEHGHSVRVDDALHKRHS